MIAHEFDKIYKETENYVEDLKESFLKKHLDNPLASPDDYDYDVRSFCILCHAALEDYTETIALRVLHYAVENYINKHFVSETIMALMHFKANGSNFFDKLEDETQVINIYDYTRKILQEIKASFSKEILIQNHGASLKYMRQLLMPVAIDIPSDVDLLDSLKQLANERGFFAHKFRDNGTLKRSIEPEKAKILVDDCMLICWDLRDKAKAKVTVK